MFLIAVTKNQIQVKLDNSKFKIDHVKIDPLFATIVTDSFLSQYFTDTNGFSIIESPLINRPDVRSIILSEIIFDKKENKLSISSNTQSGRPIYYHLNVSGEFYCSTHISMLKKAGVLIEENIDVLPEFFMYQFVTPPKTLYKNINRLSFGGKLCIKLADGKCIAEPEQKYDPFSIKSIIYQESDSIEKIVEQTYADILRSVNRLSPCSNRLAVLLSGGLDSSILFNVCKNIFGINKSYSTSYPFENADDDREKQYALSAADAFGSDHYLYESDNNEFLFGFLEAMSIVEEPVMCERISMLYLLYKKGIPQDKNIVVCGQGADMTFGDPLHSKIYIPYIPNKHRAIYKLLSLYPLFSLVKAASKITKRGHGFIKRIEITESVNNIDRPLEDQKNIIYSIFSKADKDWVCKYLNVNKKDITANRYELLKPFSNHSIYIKALILDIINNGQINPSSRSKICEFNKKIIYYPYLDLELLNNAFSINWETKLKQPKNILRCVARDLNIPQFIIEREKNGFGVQSRKWASKGGVLDPLIDLASKCIDKNIIMDIQPNERRGYWRTLWTILNYAIWKRLFIDNEPLDTLREELLRSIAEHN